MSRSGATLAAVLLAQKADWLLRVEDRQTENPVFKLWARDWHDAHMPFTTSDRIDWRSMDKPGVWLKNIIGSYSPYQK